MSMGPFGLGDAEFWGDPLKNLEQAASPYDRKPRRVLVIDGPGEVNLGARQSLPLPVYYLRPQSDAIAFAFQDQAVVIASRGEDRAVFSDKATPPLTVPREHSDYQPDPHSFVGTSEVLDLKKRPALPWKPGTWFVRVILRDLVSNTTRIHLGDSPAKYQDPEVEKFLREQKPPAPAPVFPEAGAPLPRYDLYGKSPAVPDSAGVALHADRLFAMRPDQPWELSAAFRLAPLPHEIVPNASGSGPQAIIPITLVLIGTQNAFALPFTVRAPAYGKAGDAELTGYFALDLRDVPGFDPRPQTYFVYAFAGEAMAGPVPVDIGPGR